MKRFAMATAAAAIFASAFSTSSLAQELDTICSRLGKVPRHHLVANEEDKIPTLKYQMVPEKTECVTGKAEHKIAGAQKPLDTIKDAMAVVNAVRDLVRTGFTDSEDLKKVIEYVAEVEKKDAARPKKKVAGHGSDSFSAIFKEEAKK